MKYVIIENDQGQLNFDTATAAPQAYVAEFEPIDVIEGRMIACNEEGKIYYFGSNSKVDKTPNSKGIGIVDVGSWDVNNGEPLMVEISDSNLKEQLREFLIMQVKENDHHIESNASWEEVINSVEKLARVS